MEDADLPKTFASAVDRGVRLVGSAIETFGVLVVVAGIAWPTWH